MFLILTCRVSSLAVIFIVNQLSRSPRAGQAPGGGPGNSEVCRRVARGQPGGRGGLYTAQIVSWPSAQHAANKLDPGKNDNINNAE